MNDQDKDLLQKEQADLWAMSYGFSSAEDMQQWGDQAEKEYQEEQALKKGAD